MRSWRCSPRCVLYAPSFCFMIFVWNLLSDGYRFTGIYHTLDFKNPPPLESGVHEAIRLNEFLAYLQHDCSAYNVRVPDQAYGIPVCINSSLGLFKGSGGSLHLLSIFSALDTLDFERSLNLAVGDKISVTVVGQDIPKKDLDITHITLLNAKVVPVNDALISASAYSDSAQALSLPSVLSLPQLMSYFRRRNSRVDVLKLSITSKNIPDFMARLIDDGITFNSFSGIKQLHIVIRIDHQDTNLIYTWYRVCNVLYYKANFALYSAVQMGQCGRTMENCIYKLSFVKFSAFNMDDVQAPIAGFGSPEEEFTRLYTYMQQPHIHCSDIGSVETNRWTEGYSGQVWRLCMDAPYSPSRNNCTVYYFSVGLPDYGAVLEPLINEDCQIIVFDPTLAHDINQPERRLHYISSGLGAAASDTFPGRSADMRKQQTWRMRTLDYFIDSYCKSPCSTPIDLLMLDLHGGEWDSLDSTLSGGSMQKFKQVVIRTHLWYGEENHNYRKMFTAFYRMHLQGFRLFDSWSIPTDSARIHTCNKKNCIGMGWVKLQHLAG